MRPDLLTTVAFLRSPHAYAERPQRVRTIETHFAWVFLTARHAYKLKKPLRHGSMDYRTLAARRRGCHEELRLNRRLAPTVYEAVVPLRADRSGTLRLTGHATRGLRIEDYLIKMRRLPSSAMLDRLLASARVSRARLRPLVSRLSSFFDAAAPRPLPGEAYIGRLRRQVRLNRRALRRFGDTIDQCMADECTLTQLALLRRDRDGLAARGMRLVDGHGDLRAEHVCLAAPVSVLDCLEFDRDLRRLDPAEEIAHLLIEFDDAGRSSLRQWLWREFCTRRADAVDESTLQFYLSHRAMTRAKLAAWHLGDPQFPDPAPWVERTNHYLGLAVEYARRALRSRASRRPTLQQRSQRLATQHSRQRVSEQRRDRQHGELRVV